MALLTAIMAMLMMLALAATLTLTTTTETAIAANHRDGTQGLYAGEAAAALAIDRLRSPVVWDAVAGAASPTMMLQGALSELLQVGSIDPRIEVSVSASPAPDGDRDVLVVQAIARGPRAIRRNLQLTIRRRLGEDLTADPVIDVVSWREQ